MCLSCAEIMPSKHDIVDNTLHDMKRLEKDSCKNRWNWNWLDKFGKTSVPGKKQIYVVDGCFKHERLSFCCFFI